MMDFLNNIWVALSTPNEVLMKFLSLPMLCIEIPLTLYLLISVFKLTTTKKQSLLYIVITILTGIISTYFLNNPFNVIFNFISSFIIIHFTLKTNLLKTIVATVFPSIVFAIIESLLFNPYITLMNITYNQLTTIPIYKIPLSLIAYAIAFILIFIIRNRNFYINLLDDIDKKSKSLIAFNFIFGLVYIIIEIIITMKYLDILPLGYTFANFVMLLLYFSISLYSISKVIKLSTTTKELESAEEYNKTLRILHDNVRGFKHDFDNIVTTIGGYINTDDMEGLKTYYVQLQKDCEKVNNLYVLNPSSINNPRYL